MSNNNIVDASASPKGITVFGNVNMGALAPHVSGSNSYKFLNSGSVLNFSPSTAVDLSSDFTIEFWKFRSLLVDPTTINIKLSNTNSFSFVESVTDCKMYYMGSSSATAVVSSSSNINAGDWDHYAIVRSSSSIKVYLNGQEFSTVVTNSDDFSSSTIALGSSGSFGFESGYVSDLRFSSSALYASSFNVPTSPLFFQQDTELLSAKRSYLTAESYLADSDVGTVLTTTANQTVASSRKTPYDIPVFNADKSGGSAYMHDSADRIQIDTNSVDMSGDFTVEMWIRPDEFSSSTVIPIVFDNSESANQQNALKVEIEPDAIKTSDGIADISYTVDRQTLLYNWNHVAVVRSSGTITTYLNGKASATTISNSNDMSKASLSIGCSPNYSQSSIIAYYSDFRISSNAVYVSDFNVPNSILTATESTEVLLSFDGAVIVDKTAKNSVSVFGDVVHTTDEKPFAEGTSIVFDGNNDYMKVVQTEISLDDEFTIEAMINPSTVSGVKRILTFSDGSNVRISGANIVVSDADGDLLTSSSGVTSGAWSHIAVTRDANSVIRMFINGDVDTNIATSTNRVGSFGDIVVGASLSYDEGFAGNMTDIRVTQNAVYTGDFNAHTESYGIDATPV
jgi:hypothetical protein